VAGEEFFSGPGDQYMLVYSIVGLPLLLAGVASGIGLAMSKRWAMILGLVWVGLTIVLEHGLALFLSPPPISDGSVWLDVLTYGHLGIVFLYCLLRLRGLFGPRA
jgi:hypothetical protein